jgi:hypothetical protein
MPSDKIYSKVEEFRATFQNQYGSLNCFDLIGCDFNMETERQRWQKTGLDTKGLGLVGVVNILLRSNHDQAG